MDNKKRPSEEGKLRSMRDYVLNFANEKIQRKGLLVHSNFDNSDLDDSFNEALSLYKIDRTANSSGLAALWDDVLVVLQKDYQHLHWTDPWGHKRLIFALNDIGESTAIYIIRAGNDFRWTCMGFDELKKLLEIDIAWRAYRAMFQYKLPEGSLVSREHFEQLWQQNYIAKPFSYSSFKPRQPDYSMWLKE